MIAPAIDRTPAQAWCTFRLGGGDYGVALARVEEVLRPLPVTRLPLAPPALAGLVNLRGRILPVIDPRDVLGIRQPHTSGTESLVVVSSAEGPVALLVDAIGDVRRADSGLPPPSLPPLERAGEEETALIERTLALPGQLLVVLDLDRVLARAFALPGPALGPRAGGARP